MNHLLDSSCQEDSNEYFQNYDHLSIQAQIFLALKALAIEKGGSINAWDAYKLIGQGAWWHGLREAVVESELLDVTGKRRGTRYVVAGGAA